MMTIPYLSELKKVIRLQEWDAGENRDGQEEIKHQHCNMDTNTKSCT